MTYEVDLIDSYTGAPALLISRPDQLRVLNDEELRELAPKIRVWLNTEARKIATAPTGAVLDGEPEDEIERGRSRP